MKPTGIIFLMLASHELCHAVKSSKQSGRVGNQYWTWATTSPATISKNAISRQSDDSSSTDSSSNSSSNSSDSSSDESKMLRIPMVNFYSSIPNALGFTGQGFLWIRELSAAVGTPIPIFVMAIPMLLAGIGLIFIPDFTQLGLPLFYPGGGESESTLPGLPDFADFDFLKQAGMLLPPSLLSKRSGRQ